MPAAGARIAWPVGQAVVGHNPRLDSQQLKVANTAFYAFVKLKLMRPSPPSDLSSVHAEALEWRSAASDAAADRIGSLVALGDVLMPSAFDRASLTSPHGAPNDTQHTGPALARPLTPIFAVARTDRASSRALLWSILPKPTFLAI